MNLLSFLKNRFAAAVTRSSQKLAYEELKRIEPHVYELSAGARRLSDTVAQMSSSIEESRKP